MPPKNFPFVSILILFICSLGVDAFLLSCKLGDKLEYSAETYVSLRSVVNGTSRSDGNSKFVVDFTAVLECVEISYSSCIFVLELVNASYHDQDNILWTAYGSLGKDVFFQLERNGHVKTIWWSEDDNENLLKLKLGIVEALQAYDVPIDEVDIPCKLEGISGHHICYSRRSTSRDGSAVMFSRRFQSNPIVSQVPDSLDHVLDGNTYSTIVSEGYIQAAGMHHNLDIVSRKYSKLPEESEEGSSERSDLLHVGLGASSGVDLVLQHRFASTATRSHDLGRMKKAAFFTKESYVNPQKDSFVVATGSGDDVPRNIYSIADADFREVKDYGIGSSFLGLSFHAEVNFTAPTPCSTENRLAMGSEASATLSLLGFSTSAFSVRAVYSMKDISDASRNAIDLYLWGQQYYHVQLPSADCKTHTSNIFHSAPGLSVSYTVWVGIVPVTFIAKGWLDMALDWSWKMCAEEREAALHVVPKVTIGMSGGAETDLFGLLWASVTVEGSVEGQMDPRLQFAVVPYSLSIEAKLKCQLDASVLARSKMRKCPSLWHCGSWGAVSEMTLWSSDIVPADLPLFRKLWIDSCS